MERLALTLLSLTQFGTHFFTASTKGKAISTIRDKAKKLGITFLTETRPLVIQAIRRVDSSIKETTSHLSLLKCLDAAQLYNEFKLSSLLVDEVKTWNKLDPDPVNYQVGRLGGEESYS